MRGAVCLIDDILVFGKTQVEHDSRLDQVFQCLLTAGLTLNESKCEFSKIDIRLLEKRNPSRLRKDQGYYSISRTKGSCRC